MDESALSKIKAHWDQRARTEGCDPNFTLPDYNLRHLEAEYISRHLKPDDVVLDIGCGNGTTTLRFAGKVRRIVGADYAPAMVEKAKELHPAANAEYAVQDVTRLSMPDASFDAVISERCLINLPDWPTQQKALREIARVLKPGGRYLMCESFDESFTKFEELRRQLKLSPMKRHWNNCLFKEEYLQEFLPQLFRVVSVEKMGLYYLISRLVHPLLVRPNDPTYDAPINEIAARLTLLMDPACMADISVNGLYVLQKETK